MAEERTSNYIKLCDEWAEKFLQMKKKEFEAQANILFDYSATDFNHVESAVSTAEMGVRRLAEVAGLPLKGITFEMS